MRKLTFVWDVLERLKKFQSWSTYDNKQKQKIINLISNWFKMKCFVNFLFFFFFSFVEAKNIWLTIMGSTR